MKSILFVSCVHSWGGSEILWSETAALLAKEGNTVAFAISYQHAVIQKLQAAGARHIPLGNADRPALLERVLKKVKLKKHAFVQTLLQLRPQLVVINLSNNFYSTFYLSTCKQLGIPYVTIVNLVPNLLLAFNNDSSIDAVSAAFAGAHLNYFVSQQNLRQHTLMIGAGQPNAKVILNPFTVPADVAEDYPPVTNGHYHIAMVGRLEVYHKGHDLLLQVVKEAKWRDRPITFNVYGTGLHPQLLERLVTMYGLSNVVLHGHVSNVAEVWKTNHLLLMPSRMEGQSLALIEAMWCSRAALVTDVGGATELITDGETGFVAPYPSVAELEEVLERAWSGRHQWKAMGEAAGKRIRSLYTVPPVVAFAEEIAAAAESVTAS